MELFFQERFMRGEKSLKRFFPTPFSETFIMGIDDRFPRYKAGGKTGDYVLRKIWVYENLPCLRARKTLGTFFSSFLLFSKCAMIPLSLLRNDGIKNRRNKPMILRNTSLCHREPHIVRFAARRSLSNGFVVLTAEQLICSMRLPRHFANRNDRSALWEKIQCRSFSVALSSGSPSRGAFLLGVTTPARSCRRPKEYSRWRF